MPSSQSPQQSEPVLVVNADRLRDFAAEVFLRAGVPHDIGLIVAQSLVEADLRGHPSHGIGRLPVFVQRVRSRAHDPLARPRIESASKNTAVIDGGNGFGQLAAKCAAEVAVEKAADSDIAVVVVRRTQNCGILAPYVEHIAMQSMIGAMCANGAPAIAPAPGSKPILGTNPLAVSFPHVEPITLDMSTAVVARDKIMVAHREGRQIPQTWALDSDGQPTTDPARALKGSLLPLGGHKGFGLALSVELLAGVLAGAGMATEVGWLYSTDRPQDSGCCIAAIRVGAFMLREEYDERVSRLVAEIRGAGIGGASSGCLPGEIEHRTRQERLRAGIPLHQTTAEALQRLGEEVGVATIH